LTFLEIEFVRVPAGEFWMGADTVGDKGDAYLGRPRHRVYLPGFWIACTPVTSAQYQVYVEATRVSAPSLWEGGKPLPGTENHPVVSVSWADARRYCDWLTETLGHVHRLPTEAEWEKAARGPDGRVYPWGDAWDPSFCNTSESGLEATTPVDRYPQGASPYGVLDLAGNVWEWTSSARADYPYEAADGRESEVGGDSVRRIVRGGSCLLDQRYARCATRYGSDPMRRPWVYGFRVVRGDGQD
jgi:formylglycine-generating enzyme required for sulfatase activity